MFRRCIAQISDVERLVPWKEGEKRKEVALSRCERVEALGWGMSVVHRTTVNDTQ